MNESTAVFVSQSHKYWKKMWPALNGFNSPLNTLFVQTAVSVSVMFYILILTTKTNTAPKHTVICWGWLWNAVFGFLVMLQAAFLLHKPLPVKRTLWMDSLCFHCRDKGLLRGMVLSESSEALNSGCVACNREHFLVLAAFQPLTESFPSLAGKKNVYFKVYCTNC